MSFNLEVELKMNDQNLSQVQVDTTQHAQVLDEYNQIAQNQLTTNSWINHARLLVYSVYFYLPTITYLTNADFHFD